MRGKPRDARDIRDEYRHMKCYPSRKKLQEDYQIDKMVKKIARNLGGYGEEEDTEDTEDLYYRSGHVPSPIPQLGNFKNLNLTNVMVLFGLLVLLGVIKSPFKGS